ncbi:MAG: hypothetical protein AMJ46_06075 [Latescibacteria bacterium DG_63]|nr:MAG: hypothetical protein AMJ46_06075 [Latescibacteria bacterium DG_63]
MSLARSPTGLFLYRAVVTIAFLAVSPVWLVGLLTRPELWKSRIGLVPRLAARTAGQPARVWIHASSVGEVRAATRLIEEMRQKRGVEIVLSTMTSAGHSVARASLREVGHFFFLPLDVPFVVARALRRIKAEVLLLVETELWPSLVFEAKKRDMKVAIVNGKVSPRGLKGYRRFRFLFEPVVRMLDAVLVQSRRHMVNYENLGVPSERIAITGSTKQDLQPRPDGELALRRKAGWSSSEIVLAAGSTRPGEERILCEGFVRAKASCDRLRLILAPRHLRRASHVARVAASFGLAIATLSGLRAGPSKPTKNSTGAETGGGIDVLILDTIGDLVTAYRESDIAFIGGTLSGHGGHNVLEPAAAGLPILAGPSTDNIEDDCNALCEVNALVTVRDSSDIERALKDLTESSEERGLRGGQAAAFFSSRPVASLLTLEYLERAGIL